MKRRVYLDKIRSKADLLFVAYAIEGGMSLGSLPMGSYRKRKPDLGRQGTRRTSMGARAVWL